MKPLTLLTLLLCIFISACQEKNGQEQADKSEQSTEESLQTLIQCPDNRPDVCTQIYQPVCGLVDTGIRCITTPCPSAEYKTFGNACTACSDKNVTGYSEGECPKDEDKEEEDSPAE